MAVDPGRVARALWLECERMDVNRFLITGGAEAHVVQDDQCDCTDSRMGHYCKHRCRALLENLAPEVLDALRLLVPQAAVRRTA